MPAQQPTTADLTEWVATEWVRRSDIDQMQPTRITITRLASPAYDGERFAVRHAGQCLNADGRWEDEPSPSNRDDAFYARCRFPSFGAAADALARSGR